MAASNRDTQRRTRIDGRTLSRYDLVLLVIPATFVLALAIAQVSPFAVSTVLAAASLVGALAVVDGLFVNPPRGPDE
jgi:small-conductance mechanosensitive channel